MDASTTPVRVGGSDVVVSRVGFGCASLMRLPSTRQRRNLIAAALDAGITHFDVARMYGLGAAESELARALGARRDHVTIATKFGIEVSGAMQQLGRLQAPARALLARSSRTRTAVRSKRDLLVVPRVYDVAKARRSLDTSLRKLSVDHVDILFLHDPRPQDEIDGAALQEFLVQAKAAGKIRAWGMSLDDASGVEVLSRLADSGVVQLRHDVLGDTRPFPQSIAFGVLADHSLISRWLSQAPDARQSWTEQLGADPLERELLATLLLTHTLEQDGVVAALYSTTQPARLGIPESLIRSPLPSDQAEAFARCLAHDRDAILRLATR